VNNTFKLGRSITKIVPFHLPIKKQQEQQPKQREITNKLVITMVVIAKVKIAGLLML
jgi:hypothetical protein